MLSLVYKKYVTIRITIKEYIAVLLAYSIHSTESIWFMGFTKIDLATFIGLVLVLVLFGILQGVILFLLVCLL